MSARFEHSGALVGGAAAAAAAAPVGSSLSVDPALVYPEVEGLPNTYNTFRIKSDVTHRSEALKAAHRFLAKQKATFMGFQCNQALHFSHTLAPYLDMCPNNIGDPFGTGSFTLNTKFMERAVLDYFASLWHAKWPSIYDHPKYGTYPDSYWGYVLSMGSTEGNLNAMWTARDYLSGKKLLFEPSSAASPDAPLKLMYCQPPSPSDRVHAYTPVAFFSTDTHYSITKAIVMMSVRTFSQVGNELFKGQCPLPGKTKWPDEVPSDSFGAIDIDALTLLVEFFARHGFAILIIFNYGTTFKGAYDNVEAAGNKLMPIFRKYGLDNRKVQHDPKDHTKFEYRTGYWIHVDGALGAAHMPFIEMAYNKGKVKQRGPNFDFRLSFVHSIVMSGHKWIGAPMPCGVYMTKVKYQIWPPSRPGYVGTPDTTFAGSRNALSAMILWDYFTRYSTSDLINKAIKMEEMANYAVTTIKAHAPHFNPIRTPLSLSLYFKQPSKSILTKYSLPSVKITSGNVSHIFIMEHVTKALVDSLANDLKNDKCNETCTTFPPSFIPKTFIAQFFDNQAMLPLEGRGFEA